MVLSGHASANWHSDRRRPETARGPFLGENRNGIEEVSASRNQPVQIARAPSLLSFRVTRFLRMLLSLLRGAALTVLVHLAPPSHLCSKPACFSWSML